MFFGNFLVLSLLTFCSSQGSEVEIQTLENGVVQNGYLEGGSEVYYKFHISGNLLHDHVAYFVLEISRLFSPEINEGVWVEMGCSTKNPPSQPMWNATRSFRLLSMSLKPNKNDLYLTIRSNTHTKYSIIGLYCTFSTCLTECFVKGSLEIQGGEEFSANGPVCLDYISPVNQDYGGIIASVTPIAGNTKMYLIPFNDDGNKVFQTTEVPNILMINTSFYESHKWKLIVESQEVNHGTAEYEVSIQTFNSHGILIPGISKYSTTIGGGGSNPTYFKVNESEIAWEGVMPDNDDVVLFSLLVSVYPKTQLETFKCLNIFASQDTSFPNSHDFTWSTHIDNVWEDTMLPLRNIKMNLTLYVSVAPCKNETLPTKFMISFVSRQQPLFIPMESQDIRPITLQSEFVDFIILRTYDFGFRNFSVEVDSCTDSRFYEVDNESFFQFERLGSTSFQGVKTSLVDDGFSYVYGDSRKPGVDEDFFVLMNFSSFPTTSNYAYSIFATTFLDNLRPVIFFDTITTDADDDDDCDKHFCNLTVEVSNSLPFDYVYKVFSFPPQPPTNILGQDLGDPGLPSVKEENFYTSCSLLTMKEEYYDGVMTYDRFHNLQHATLRVKRGTEYVINVLVEDPETLLTSTFNPAFIYIDPYHPPVHPVCFGKNQMDKNVCNGHGSCVSEDDCNCDSMWFGKDCSLSIIQFLGAVVAPIICAIIFCSSCIIGLCICCCLFGSFCFMCLIPLFTQSKSLKSMKNKLNEYEHKIIQEKNNVVPSSVDEFGASEVSPLLLLSSERLYNNDENRPVRFSGKRNGHGKIYEYDTTTSRFYLAFEGEFKDGVREGKGREFYIPEPTFGPDQGLIKFEGLYQGDKRHGKGIEYSIVNEKTLSGIWKNGMIYQIERDFVDLPKISISDFSIDFLKDKIGSGSEGDVFRVTYHDQECALKILRNPTSTPTSSTQKMKTTSSSSSSTSENEGEIVNKSQKFETYRTRLTGRQHVMFTRSQKIWSKVSHHPFILDLHAWTGVGETKDNLKGYITEMCDTSLFEAIVRKTLSWKSMKRVIFNIAVGMEYLHSHSVMHRDLKAGNVLLDFQENPKICDFEFCRYDDFDFRKEVAMNISVLGTPGYLAPEILRGIAYTKSCDVFSYGILLYCCYFETIDPYRDLKICTGCKKEIQTSGLYIHQHVSRCGLRPLIIDSKIDQVIEKDKDPWIVKELMVQCWDVRPEKRPTFSDIVKLFQRKSKDQKKDEVILEVIDETSQLSSINSEKSSSINCD